MHPPSPSRSSSGFRSRLASLLPVGLACFLGACNGSAGTHVTAVGNEEPPAAAATASDAGAAPHASPETVPLSFAFVVDAGDPVVLVGDDGDEAWATSAPRLVADGAVFAARRDVDLQKMPARYASMVGKAVRLDGPSGEVCEATVDGLALVVRADPRYEVRLDWKGEVEDDRHAPTPTSDIAEAVWAMSAPSVVAHVKPTSGSCAGATWAHGAGASRVIAPAVDADPATRADALAYVSRLPSFVAAEKDYRTTGEEPRAKTWTAATYTTSATSVFLTSAGVRYVWVSLQANEGCGGFNAGIGVLLRRDPASPGGFRVVHEQEGGVLAPITALVDEGKGMPTLLFEGTALRAENEAYVIDSVEVPSQDCPC